MKEQQCPKTWPLDKMKYLIFCLTLAPLVIPVVMVAGKTGYWEKTRDDDALLGHTNLSVRLDPHDLSPSNKDVKGSMTSCKFPQACSSLTHLGSQEAIPVLRSLGSTYFLVLKLSWLPSVWLNSLQTCLHSLICLCPFSSVRFKPEHRSPNYSLPRRRKNFIGYRNRTLIKAGEAFIRLLILLDSSSFTTCACALILNSLLPRHAQVSPPFSLIQKSIALILTGADRRINSTSVSYMLGNLRKTLILRNNRHQG